MYSTFFPPVPSIKSISVFSFFIFQAWKSALGYNLWSVHLCCCLSIVSRWNRIRNYDSHAWHKNTMCRNKKGAASLSAWNVPIFPLLIPVVVVVSRECRCSGVRICWGKIRLLSFFTRSLQQFVYRLTRSLSLKTVRDDAPSTHVTRNLGTRMQMSETHLLFPASKERRKEKIPPAIIFTIIILKKEDSLQFSKSSSYRTYLRQRRH